MADTPTPKKPRRPRQGGPSTVLPADETKRLFLASLARYGNVKLACTAAKMARDTAYTWRAKQPDFKAAWEDALKDAVNVLEREAYRRAVKGTDKPVYQQGVQVGTIREYSDTLLIFLLKGAAPDKYRERVQTEHSGELKLSVSYVNDWRSQGLPEQANTTDAPPLRISDGDAS